jgi:hypothetical protein
MLYFADKFNLTPVIKYQANVICAEDKEINGTKNPFEYYFEPTSDITVEETISSYNVVRYNHRYTILASSINAAKGGYSYRVSDIYIDALGEIYRKYIRLNSYVKPIIENDIKKLLAGKKSIGVHVRGGEWKNNGVKNHPVAIPPIEHAEYVSKLILEHGFEQVFIATDDAEAVEVFKSKFGNKVVYFNDIVRTTDDSFVCLINSNREHHRYLLGLEVLRDAYTLAACDGLIAGLSNVSMTARIIKASKHEKYEYENIIDKGLNSNGTNPEKFRRKNK